MSLSITQDILPLFAQVITWTLIIGGILLAFGTLLFDEWGQYGRLFVYGILSAVAGGICLFFVQGGSITL